MVNKDAEALRRRDADFVARLKRRDKSVMTDIDRSYAPTLCKLLRRRIGPRFNEEDLNNVIQDALLNVWDKFDAEKGSTVRGYFFEKARLLALSKLRTNYKKPIAKRVPKSQEARQKSPDIVLERNELTAQETNILLHVDELILTLTDRQKKALQARFYSGETRWAMRLQEKTGISSRLWSKAAVDAVKKIEKGLLTRGIRFNQEEGQYEVA